MQIFLLSIRTNASGNAIFSRTCPSGRSRSVLWGRRAHARAPAFGDRRTHRGGYRPRLPLPLRAQYRKSLRIDRRLHPDGERPGRALGRCRLHFDRGLRPLSTVLQLQPWARDLCQRALGAPARVWSLQIEIEAAVTKAEQKPGVSPRNPLPMTLVCEWICESLPEVFLI